MNASDYGADLEAGVLAHPLFSGSVSIITPPVREMYLEVKRVIALRELGCTFAGPSGAGKTYAISMMTAMLRSDFPRLCFLRYTAGNQQIPSIRAFYKGFLHSVGHMELNGETWDLRNRLVRSMASDARKAGMNIVLLFIDEANAMTLQDFLFLKDVYNDLEREDVQLITVMLGQSPDLDAVLENLEREGRLDLISRFAMRRLQMRPYNNVKDIDVVFQHIDEIRWGGHTWTEYFLPVAYAAKFRLRDQAGNAFAALRRAATSGPRGERVQFPARQFFLMVRSFMLDASADDADGLDDLEGRWDRAVLEARLKDAMHLITPQGKKGLKK